MTICPHRRAWLGCLRQEQASSANFLDTLLIFSSRRRSPLEYQITDHGIYEPNNQGWIILSLTKIRSITPRRPPPVGTPYYSVGRFTTPRREWKFATYIVRESVHVENYLLVCGGVPRDGCRKPFKQRHPRGRPTRITL